ncbi:hypothetical protein AB1Y20_004134 [Prymnesium parvum]|uniref:Fibronectin type-III domain-containing protein n=1 Tax=Prymnesium parvum TaxID=97485 RepID=A0AB34J714_PRYPA
MEHRLLGLLCGVLLAPHARAGPTCISDAGNTSSASACGCSNSSLPRLAFVSCSGSILDSGFKEMATRGIAQAAANGSACVQLMVTNPHEDDCSVEAMLELGALLPGFAAVYTADFALSQAMPQVAAAYPSSNFASVDLAFKSDLPNLQGILFAEEQAAYLAGYLAGLVTQAGVLGTVLGAEIPPVIRYANGFANGVRDACGTVGKSCITIHKYVPSFYDLERGWRVATLLAARGADVIFEAGGPMGTCGVAGASQLPHVRAVVGVDVDRYVQSDACPLGRVNASKVITSAAKRVDQAVGLAGTFTPGDKIFSASNGAIGITPCHEACGMVLGCGGASCHEAGAGGTVASAHHFVLSTIFPAFASGDTILANTQVDAATGSIVHDYGAPNEHTRLEPRSTAVWAQLGGVGVGAALSGHTAVALVPADSFGPEIGGRAKIVVFGGQSAAGLSNEVLVFIPDDITYSFLEDTNGTCGVPQPRAHHSVVLDASLVMWVFFGRTAAGEVDDVWSIDLRSPRSVWVKHAPTGADGGRLPAARAGHTTCLLDGRVLLFGGLSGAATLDDLWQLDLATRVWTEMQTATRPPARADHTATALLGKMYVVFGLDSHRTALGDMWAFSFSDGWEQIEPSPEARAPSARWSHAAVVWHTPHDGPVLAISGGQSGAVLNSDIHTFTPATAGWSQQLAYGAHLRSHSTHAVVSLGTRLFLVGGIVQEGAGAPERTSDVYVHNSDAALDPPTLARATAASITIRWVPSSSYTRSEVSIACSASIISSYKLQLVSPGSFTNLYLGEETSFILEGLSSGTTYGFRVRGEGGWGHTGWSAVSYLNTSRVEEPQTLPVFRLGVLLPLFASADSAYAPFSWSPVAAVLKAVRELNNKSDGVFDAILPETQLHVAYLDSKCDPALALQGALQLTRTSFGGEGVSAIIGAGCSDAAASAAQVAEGSRIPIISPSATSALLSNGRQYPFFLRTCPSDAFAGEGIVRVLTSYLGYRRVALVHSTDSFGNAGANAIYDAAHAHGLQVAFTRRFTKDASDFSAQQRDLKQSGLRVVVLFCTPTDAGHFLRSAYANEALGGAGYLWFLPTIGADLWADEVLASDLPLREKVLRGAFGLNPNSQPGDSAVYRAYASRPTRVACDLQADDDDHLIWFQDHDGSNSTPPACAWELTDHDSNYDTFAFDAVVSLALALHHMLYTQNRTQVFGEQLLDTLIRHVRFDGASGLVDFYDASSDPEREFHGDRRVGVQYKLVNYVDAARAKAEVGAWTPCGDEAGACSWAVQWDEREGVPPTFSTADNTPPPESAEVVCTRAGEVLDHAGRCVCDDGYEVDERLGHCDRCEVGQHSRRATHNTSGSAGCTLCADGYYRRSPHAAASECEPCAGIYGVTCRDNATIETLDVWRGHWRLSPYSLNVVKCASSQDGGTLSPCAGGADAGVDGGGYCRPEFKGPRCELCTSETEYFANGKCVGCPDPHGRIWLAFGLVLIIPALFIALFEAITHFMPRTWFKLKSFLVNLLARLSALAVIPKLKLAIAFLQTVWLIPGVFDLELPEFYYHWLQWVEIFRFDWADWLFPASCYGEGFRSHLLLQSCLPFALMASAIVAYLASIVGRLLVHGRRWHPPWRSSLLGTVPPLLFCAFCLTPITSTAIFATWTCETYDVNSISSPQVQRRFLRDDPSIVCEESDQDYSRVVPLAYGLVAVWPVGMPLLFSAVLLMCRASIRLGQTTRLVRVTAFLHREYDKAFYWWEVIFLLQRIVLVGFVQWIVHPTHRLLFAFVVALAYLIILLLAKPYKRTDVCIIAYSSQAATAIILLMAGYIHQFTSLEDISETTGTDLLYVFGFESKDSLVAGTMILMLTFVGSLDQVGNIKNVLIRMMPGCKIFLDVDDLEEIGELANYVEASQSMLIFLSKGYFSSNNCLEELDSAMCAMVPLILVHETDASRGAAPLDVLRSECPRPLFDDRKEIIPWHRMAEFQLFSLKKIAEHMLHATPLYINSPKPTLYVPGELTTQPLTFRRQAKVHLSSHNPGVQDIINELDARYGLRSLDIKTFTSDTSCARAFAQSPPASVPKTLRREFFLLHLKRDTFVGPEGVALAEDVRALRAQGVELVLTHENDVDRGGCPFSRLFEITPDDLIKTGLYKKIAIPFHAHPCRAVSIALLAKALGAGTSGRAWFFEKNSGRRKKQVFTARRKQQVKYFGVSVSPWHCAGL